MKDREQFLHAAERKHRQQKRAALGDGVVDRIDEPGDLVHALLAVGPLGHAARRLDDQRVEMSDGEMRALQRALVFEQHVACQEDLAHPVVDFHGGGSGDMAGRVEHELDLTLLALDFFDLLERQADKAADQVFDILVREERIARDAVLLLLLLHHIGGIVQHLLDQHAAGLGEQHRGLGMLAHDHRQAADVIQMTVRDDDEVELDAAQQFELRQGAYAGCLGVQAAVDQNVQAAYLQKE